jgi:hypothetical protein
MTPKATRLRPERGRGLSAADGQAFGCTDVESPDYGPDRANGQGVPATG